MLRESDNKFIITTGDVKCGYDIIDFVEGKDISSLKNQALRLGADGLIFVRMNTYTYETGSTVSGIGSYTSHIDHTYYGTAIIKKETPKDEILLTKKKDLGRLQSETDADFTLMTAMSKNGMLFELGMINNSSKAIRAISLNVCFIDCFDDEYPIEDLHFFFNNETTQKQYTGDSYSACTTRKECFEELKDSYKDIRVEINKIIFGEDIISRKQEAINREIEASIRAKNSEIEANRIAKEEARNRQLRDDYINLSFTLFSDCHSAKEMHEYIVNNYPDGVCGGLILNLEELGNLANSEGSYGNLKSVYIQKIKEEAELQKCSDPMVDAFLQSIERIDNFAYILEEWESFGLDSEPSLQVITDTIKKHAESERLYGPSDKNVLLFKSQLIQAFH